MRRLRFWRGIRGGPRRLWGPLGLACALAFGLAAGAGAPAASAQASSPLGAYQGETVNFGHDPTVGLDPTTCALRAGGPTLVLSNDPETVPGPGVLYQDKIRGAARIFLFHANGSREPLHFGVLMTNAGRGPINVYVEHVGVAGPGRDPLTVGKQAEHLWFLPHTQYVYTLSGHESWFLDGAAMDTAVPPGSAMAEIFDILSTGDLYITTVAQTVPSLSLAGLHVLPNTSVSAGGTPMRGTFRNADITCTVTQQVPVAGESQILLGSARTYIRGESVVDRHAATVDAGNYGVLYDLHLDLTSNPAGEYSQFALLLHAHNNRFAGIANVAGGGGLTPAVVPLPRDQPAVNRATEAVMLGMVRLFPVLPTQLDLQWMAAGGSALPVDLLVYPLD